MQNRGVMLAFDIVSTTIAKQKISASMNLFFDDVEISIIYVVVLMFSFAHFRKTRSLDLGRVRRHFQKSQADRETKFFFIKTFEMAFYSSKFFFTFLNLRGATEIETANSKVLLKICVPLCLSVCLSVCMSV